jgi:polysaccharide export outer membrane protein
MATRRFLGRVSALALIVALAGCAALPRSGPADTAVVSQAKVTVGGATQGGKVDYVLVELGKDVLKYFDFGPSRTFAGFGVPAASRSPELPLGIGDVVSVTIFEAQAGGLFIPSDAGSRAGNFVTIPNQTVDRNGTISVPYAGQVRVAGRSAAAVQTDIENLLANRAIEPQVVVTTVTSHSSEISVLGDVNQPTKLEISQAGERILDAIAQAGGLSSPGIETYVTLQRRGREATVLFDDLVKTPSENIYLAPGDTVYVNRERRTFLAFGATGASGRFEFADANLTLGEALGKAGGMLDERADPSTVFVYRIESRETVKKLGVDVSKFEGDEIPVVFRANLRDPSEYFVTQRFPMKDKDILYISNAASVELTKLLSIVNDVSSTYGGVPSDALQAKTAAKGF